MAEAVELESDLPLRAATLRYFDSQGSFAAAAAAACGAALPASVAATTAGSPQVILAWMRPTETLLLCETEAPLAALAERLGKVPGGHCVTLSGGLRVLRLRGAGVPALMSRLGGTGTMPAVGEARRGRLAEVAALALCVRAGEILLVVDRAYGAHLLEWIRLTLADAN